MVTHTYNTQQYLVILHKYFASTYMIPAKDLQIPTLRVNMSICRYAPCRYKQVRHV
jgi:hypothetical protein